MKSDEFRPWRRGRYVNIGRAFSYVFRDPQWARKLGIAVVLGLPAAALWLLNEAVLRDRALGSTPLAAIALDATLRLAWVPLFGFDLRIMRRVAAGTDLPLPTWSDLGGIARDGLKLWVVITLWMLPEEFARLLGDALAPEIGDDAPLALRGLAQLIGLVVLIVLPAAEVRLAATGSVGAGLDVGAALRTVGRNLGGYLLLLLLDFGILTLVVFGLGIGLARSGLAGVERERRAAGAR